MPLPSQSSRSRSNASVRFSVRKRRKRGNPLIRAGVLVLLAGGIGTGGWYLFFDDASPTEEASHATNPTPEERPDLIASNQPTPQQSAPIIPPTRPLERLSPDTPNASSLDEGTTESIPSQPIDEPLQRTADLDAPSGRDSIEADEMPSDELAPPVALDHVQDAMVEAERLVSLGRLTRARDILNRALFDERTSELQRADLRSRLAELSETLVFSRAVVPGDDAVRTYRIQSGDRLSNIAVRENVGNSWQFIARINGITDPGRIRVGQQLKIVNGPFHAVVHKQAYRLDLFLEDRDSAGNHLYVRSFDVGLGEFDSTPAGEWIVRNREKDPSWVNPRNPQERYDRGDPDNPIGDYWIGLDGTDDRTRLEVGYGLHGTIEPDSIGRQMSMGCVRLRDPDIELLFEVMVPEQSRVVIVD